MCVCVSTASKELQPTWMTLKIKSYIKIKNLKRPSFVFENVSFEAESSFFTSWPPHCATSAPQVGGHETSRGRSSTFLLNFFRRLTFEGPAVSSTVLTKTNLAKSKYIISKSKETGQQYPHTSFVSGPTIREQAILRESIFVQLFLFSNIMAGCVEMQRCISKELWVKWGDLRVEYVWCGWRWVLVEEEA